MTTFSERLYARLTAHPQVSAIAQGRVRPFAGGYGEDLPAIVYEVEGLDPDEFVALPAVWKGTQRVQITLHCLAMSLSDAERLRDAADAALSQGWFETGDGDLEIRGAVPNGGIDGHEFLGGSTGRVVYRCTRALSVHTHRAFA